MTTDFYGSRLRIGMILASKNTVAEPDVNAMLPEGVSVHTTRLHLVDTNPTALQKMTNDAEQAAALLASAEVDLIVFHCTAASTIDPEMGQKIAQRIQRSTGIASTATSEALIDALNTLGAKKIVLLSPYPQAVNDAEVAFFSHYGIQVLHEVGYIPVKGQGSPSAEPVEWQRRAMTLKHPDADAYFLSCTNIRVISIIDALEKSIHAPVISSNQAMLWHCLRKGGVADAVPNYGKLLRSH
jgi:maleate isomerase